MIKANGQLLRLQQFVFVIIVAACVSLVADAICQQQLQHLNRSYALAFTRMTQTRVKNQEGSWYVNV